MNRETIAAHATVGVLAFLIVAGPVVANDADRIASHDRILAEMSTLSRASCQGEEARHALQKTLDLLVAQRIQHPKDSVGLPLSGDLASTMKLAAGEQTQCAGHIARGLFEALLGDFEAAATDLKQRDIRVGCGNAMAAEEFGGAEALANVAFLRGDYEQAAALHLAPDPNNTLESVDVGSTRWALIYAMRACANEHLGRRTAALADSCVAAEQVEEPRESWNYYYPMDPAIWKEIAAAVGEIRHRLGGACGAP